MKILIYGISGRTGRLTAQEALKRGHKVVGIARNPSAINLSGVEIVEGTPYHSDTVEKAISGCDAVISTLNLFPASQSMFARITTPLDVMSVAMKNTVDQMKERGINRIILMTALGVGDSYHYIPWSFKFLMKISNIRYAYLDHDRQEKVLEKSGLDWTIVRPVMLTDRTGDLSIITTAEGNGNIKKSITREAVASFMLDCVEKGLYIHRKPGISNA